MNKIRQTSVEIIALINYPAKCLQFYVDGNTKTSVTVTKQNYTKQYKRISQN